jgi:hypothetical protein
LAAGQQTKFLRSSKLKQEQQTATGMSTAFFKSPTGIVVIVIAVIVVLFVVIFGYRALISKNHSFSASKIELFNKNYIRRAQFTDEGKIVLPVDYKEVNRNELIPIFEWEGKRIEGKPMKKLFLEMK